MKQSVRSLPRRLHRWALVAAVVIGAPALAYTQSLGEKQERKRNDELLQEVVKTMNDDCKTSIKATWDWQSFKGRLTRNSNHVGSNCGVGAEDIRRLCLDGDEGKQAVKAGIKTIVCKGDGGKDGKVHLDKKTRTLVYSTSIDAELQFHITDYLKQNL
ncbi:MAG TPA: hypothetical protein VKB80_30340 [Kofleriaceae bacterium]|nr:hypothetical protein [Kofleriaceae bacterium]